MRLHWRAFRDAAAILIILLGLTACGGSGDNTDSGKEGGGGGDNGGSGENGSGSGSEETGENDTIKDTGLVINEIMKSVDLTDSSAVKDEDGMRQSWLELYNGSGASVNLSGYSLVSYGFEKQVWEFPDMSLDDGAYLRIWGSGLDRTSRLDALHTSFSLRASAKVSLLDTSGDTLDRFEYTVPADQSWGRYPDGAKTVFYYDDPTPGTANPQGTDRFSLNCEQHLSLTAGSAYQLRVFPQTNVNWTTDNPALTIDNDGVMTASSRDSDDLRKPIEITATDAEGSRRSCMVTIVNWLANRSSLTVVANPAVDFFLDYFDDAVHYTRPRRMFETNDSFRTTNQIGSFPDTPSSPIFKVTPYGYFVSSGSEIYSSLDFNTWNDELSMRHKNLQHGFSHYHDENSQISYLYAGEYSTGKEDLHSVYRGIASGGNTQWESVLDWQSEGAFDRDNSNMNTIRHVHLTVTDPYTGHVWVGTGDRDQHSRLYYSKDNGNTFDLVGIGSQKFRSLSVWFTEDYVYWNMDSERARQHVYRIPRSTYRANDRWPPLTPELASGTTKPGIRYMVTRTDGGNFPVSTGKIYTETTSRSLSNTERAFAIEDPQYDYSESVADLTHASHWYHLWVKDQNDDDVLLMATSAEGLDAFRRDDNSRVFGFKEHADGSVDVQELLSMPNDTPGEYSPYTQLIPAMQDGAGYIYFRGRYTAHRAYQMRLNWVDQ